MSPLVEAHKLREGDRVSVDGYWLRLLRIAPANEPGYDLVLLFLNGKAVPANRDEMFLKEERD